MSVLRTIGIWVAGAFAVALLFFGYNWYRGLAPARLAKWHTDSTAVANATRASEQAAAIATVVHDTTWLTYTKYRDAVLKSGTATKRDSATFGHCDAVELTCKQQHAADTLVAHNLRAELATARNKPIERPKRLNLWGEGLYDVIHMAPVFRAGAELRLLGPITAVGAGDLSIPPAGQSRANARVLVGIRYVF